MPGPALLAIAAASEPVACVARPLSPKKTAGAVAQAAPSPAAQARSSSGTWTNNSSAMASAALSERSRSNGIITSPTAASTCRMSPR
jgi:hypothetical protein